MPPSPAQPDLARARLQHAAVDAVIGLARARPVAVVLEDLQWADQSSLQLLALVAPELAAAPVLVVATHRDQEVGAGLAAAMGALARLADTIDVPLAGLDDPSVHRLVERIAGEQVGAGVARAIAARTAGNPLFVAELTRLLRSERGLDEHGVRHAPVPAGMRDVIRRRLDRLPPQTTTVLTVAAVIGRRFDLGLLERVAHVPEDDLLDMVESAVATGLVAEDERAVGAFTFAHDLVRDTLQDSVGGTRRVRLHARVAAALLEPGAEANPSRPFELAYHLVEALPLVPADEVVPHLVAAADAALERLTFEQAEEALRQALALVDLLPAGARGAHELAVRIRLGRVLTLTRGHAWPEVREHVGRAVVLAGEVEPSPEVIQALWAAAISAGVAGELATTLEVGRKLLAWGEEHGHAAAVCLGHTALGAFTWCLGDVGTAARHCALAVDVVDAGQVDPALVYDEELRAGVSARANHALVAWLAGRDDEAGILMADAVRRAEVPGRHSAVVFARCFAAWLALFRREYALARRRASEVVELADAMGYAQFSVMGRMFAAAASEDPSTRARELEALVAGWEATGARLYLTFFRTLQAEVEVALDHVERAADLLARAFDGVQATGERFYEPEIHRLLGVVARRQGRLEEAASHYGDALGVARQLGLVALAERVTASPQVRGT